MNDSRLDDCRQTTFVLPNSIHAQLKSWAKQNRTSMIAELIRATRERAERERAAAAA